MRLSSALIGGAYLLMAAFIPRAADATTIVRLRADHIAFYYDQYQVEADGNVRVETGNGAVITGDTFSMDLKLDRFVIASHVHLASSAGSLDGAAIADFLDFKRIYFVPVLAKPDRWTYENGDYTHPLRGRQMPGDSFYFPDLRGAHESLTASSAVIGEHSFARFQNVRANLPGASVPLPSYYVYFGTNKNIAANSLSGANYDATWNATGNNNSTTAVHVRYDSANAAYLAFEQHLVSDRAYVVVSDNPATKQIHFWNMVGGETIGSRLQINLFSQLETTQKWFREPSSASYVGYASATQAFNQSFLNTNATFVNYNLVNQYLLDHPTSMQATWTTFNHRIGKTPFFESVFYGFGFNHDSLVGATPDTPGIGLQVYNNVTYTTIWNHVLGYSFSLPGAKFGDLDNPYRTYYFNATLNAQRQYNSVPHHVNSTSALASVSRTFSREFNASVSYNVSNTSDIYNQGGYVPYAPPGLNGEPDTSFLAFRGASTLRTATIATTYSASPDLVTTLTYAHRDDFPIAVPGVFAPPPLNNIGQYLYSNWLGQPPDQLTGEVRARLLPHLVVDVQRTDYFNYGTMKWSPQFIVQFSQ